MFRRARWPIWFPALSWGALLATAAAVVSQPPELATEGLDAYGGADVRGAFHFARGRYTSTGGYSEAYYVYDGRLWERWETDHPQADENFSFRLGELTSVQSHPRSVVRSLNDPELLESPFLYLCDVGWMELRDEEVEGLRQFLLRGGFVWIDDFWGEAEWQALERAMGKVLPEQTWADLPADHPVLSSLFPLEGLPQIPARDFAQWSDHDPPQIHRQPAWGIETVRLRGWHDDDGRLVAVATLNTDIGDGWEREAYGEWFFEKFSSKAYATGVNIVLYALTH